MSETTKAERYLNVTDIAAMLSISRPTVYRLIKLDETFPKPDGILPHHRRWLAKDIEEWVEKKRQ